MTISVVIPVYNCEQYIGGALESVLGQVAGFEFEVIVVDDGSTDASAQIAKSFGGEVKYHFQQNAGLGSARNTGISLSRGNFLAFLDADDLWEPTKTQMQVQLLQDQPDVEAVFGLGVQFLSPELDPVYASQLRVIDEATPTELCGTMLIRRKSFDRIGLFSTTHFGTDIEWQVRARDYRLKSAMVESVVFRRRIHPKSLTATKAACDSSYTRILKQSLDRRRRTTSR